MKIVSVKQSPKYKNTAIKYFQEKWANENTLDVYSDSIENSISATNPLPQWYLLMDNDLIVGCAGLITNDFISRMDLYPWLCALYIEEEYRGKNLGKLLINQAKNDTKSGGFSHLYLCTDHIGYYEKFNFKYIGVGYHPWGDSSRIYEISTS